MVPLTQYRKPEYRELTITETLPRPERARGGARIGGLGRRVVPHPPTGEGVAPFLNAIRMSHEAGDAEMAQIWGMALHLARAMDSAGVQAELDRLLGTGH